jgi:hypothetical protein
VVKDFTAWQGSERNCADCSRGFDREVAGDEYKTEGIHGGREK